MGAEHLSTPSPPEVPADRVLVCLRDDAHAATLVWEGERLARALGCEWQVAALGREGPALAATLHQAQSAGAMRAPADVDAADHPAAVATLARRLAATAVILGPPPDASQATDFADKLAQALPDVTLHRVGFGTALRASSSRLRSTVRAAWHDGPAVLAVLTLCTLVGGALQDSEGSANLIMVYLAGVVYVALRRSQPAALLTVLASVLLYDLIFIARGAPGLSDPRNYLLVSLVMMAVGLLISHLAAQARAQAAAAETRERRTRALNHLALALAQARTPASIRQALALAVHRSLQASAWLALPTAPADDQPPAPARSAVPAAAPPARRRVPLRAGDTVLAVLDIGMLPQAHDTPEATALLEAFANQGAMALERAQFEQRSIETAIEAERERLRSTLLAGVSHDFRTPLTTIVGSATSLLEQSHAIAPEQRAALLRGMLSEARRLHRLTSNLLDLSRMQEGAILPSLEWCPADELVEEARAAVAPVLGGRSLAVHVDDELAVWCDARLVGQALANLLDNAARHAGAAAHIAVEVSASPGHWRLVVQDDGPGIPKGLEQEVFKKFFRGQPASGDRGAPSSGTGLGLAICAAVAQLHGGSITAVAGPGARFELTLPQPQPTRTVLEGMA